MAAAKTTARRGAKTKAAAPPPEPEIDELDELDDDEVEEVEEEPAPKRGGKKAPAKKSSTKPAAESKKTKVDAPVYGTQWLADHVNAQLGTEYKTYDLRVLLRKMAKNGDLEREVGEDRSRYDFSGENDPIVKAVLKKLKSGELDKEKKEKLAALKGRKSKTGKSKDEDDEVGEELTDEDEDVDELDEDE